MAEKLVEERLTKEQREMYIATCHACLLAEYMKDCPRCRFNIGLAEKKAQENTQEVK